MPARRPGAGDPAACPDATRRSGGFAPLAAHEPEDQPIIGDVRSARRRTPACRRPRKQARLQSPRRQSRSLRPNRSARSASNRPRAAQPPRHRAAQPSPRPKESPPNRSIAAIFEFSVPPRPSRCPRRPRRDFAKPPRHIAASTVQRAQAAAAPPGAAGAATGHRRGARGDAVADAGPRSGGRADSVRGDSAMIICRGSRARSRSIASIPPAPRTTAKAAVS